MKQFSQVVVFTSLWVDKLGTDVHSFMSQSVQQLRYLQT